MPPEKRAKNYKCERCGRVFTSLMRLEHHMAAEHDPMTSRDIPATRDIPHWPQSSPRRPSCTLGMRR